MSKFSYKSLFIIFFFLLIGVVVLSRFVLPNKKVSASWWNESWSYRRTISIDNSSGSNQTNTQIKILDNYDLSSLVTAGKIQSDLDDLRFTDINGNLINYWIEDSTNNSVDVWGLLSTIPSSGTTILMYYGNSSANSVSNNSWMADIGGTITNLNGYRIHAFKGNDTYYNYLDRNVDVIVVAGGGGGAYRHGAGGGAGGLIYRESFSVTNNISVTVGNGGSGAITSGPTPNNGENSIFDSLIAIGGGRAGGWDSTSIGATGGSGGGSCSVNNVAGISGQGNSGGNGYIFGSPYNWGGGGGAGETGYNGTINSNGNGGVGLYYGDKFGDIYGENGWFSGGGGGGGHVPAATYQGLGGNGGGGDGGTPGLNSPGQDGLANTGGGGGGPTSPGGGTGKGGNGGSGIVLIRYQSLVNTPTDIISNTPSSNEEVSIGPVAYWKFDEGVGTTAYNSTSNQNNGIISGATWQNEDQCISGKCLSFNSNIITSTNTPSLNFSGDFTISLWIKPNNNTSYQGVIAKMDNITNNGYRITLRNNGKIWCDLGNANSSSGSHNVNYSANVWQHIICQRSGSNMRVYVNGVLQEEVSANNNPINATSDLYIGRQASVEYLYGYLDEVKIYPYARTADQIKQDYNSRGSTKGTSVNLGIKSNTAPSLKSKLVGYWKFDEGNGTIVNNSSNVGSTLNMTFTAGKLPIWTNNGKVNKALSFSTSQIEFTDYTTSPLDTPDGVTFSLWAYPTTLNSGRYLMYKTGAYSLSYGDSVCGAGKFGISINGGATRVWMCSLTARSLNNWYHITGSALPNGKIKIYINGVLENSADFSYATVGVSDSKLTYGDYLGGGYAFSGIIDEPKIYNTALTDEEIKQDYNAGAAIQFGSTNQTIGGTTTSLEYCIPGDTSFCTSPIAEWKMDEGVGTSTFDTSGNNNTGTLVNSPSWVQGKIGKALDFGSNKYINTVASSTLLSGDTSFTIQSWFKTNQLHSTADPNVGGRIITLYRSSGSSKIGLGFYGNNTDTLMAFTNTSPSGVFKTNSNYNDNRWHHLSATYNSSNDILKLFYDGIEVGSTNVGTISSSDSSIAQIGTLSGSYPFNGSIDHVKIYNYARTPAQVAYDYNKGGPIGWWKFDECQGNIAYDWSGVGNTGVINIGASGTQNSLGTCQVGTSAAWTNGSTGKINSSLNFDGVDDYINIGDISTLEGMNGITTSAWIYRKLDKGSHEGIISKFWDGTNRSYWTFIDGSSDKLRCLIPTDTDNDNDSAYGSVINLNQWTFITCTWDNVSHLIKAYVNGMFVGQQAQNGNIVRSNTDPIQIGRYSGDYFNGQIDDVRIYNYALTSEQVKQVYNGGAINFQ